MNATPREIVLQTLNFENPSRVPRQLWMLPWAEIHHPDSAKRIEEAFPADIIGIQGYYQTPPPRQGDPYKVGRFVDEWGCVFENLQEGIIGEVRRPPIQDWQTDTAKVHIPREWLTIDVDKINRECDTRNLFTMSGACPRPFEQLQFLRGTENLYMDLADPPEAMKRFLKQMHAFYCELLERWTATNVDALMFMDDWGSQQALLVRPALWREMFKPMYRDYIQIAHNAGKKAFMHSDGNILAIYPDLVEIGLDAVNSQLYCMGLEQLEPFAGKITFWGEIDRQNLLPNATTQEIDEAVRNVHKHLWRKGGCIAQCEFGPGAKPDNVYQVFTSWNEVLA